MRETRDESREAPRTGSADRIDRIRAPTSMLGETEKKEEKRDKSSRVDIQPDDETPGTRAIRYKSSMAK